MRRLASSRKRSVSSRPCSRYSLSTASRQENNPMRLNAVFLLVVLAFPALFPASVRAEDSVSFGTDWLAEAEYGGYYQAGSPRTYPRHRPNVTIPPGGPAVTQ